MSFSMYLYMIWAVIGNQMLFRARNIFRICHIQPTTSTIYLVYTYVFKEKYVINY